MLIAADRLWVGGRLAEGLAVEVTDNRVTALRPLGTDMPDLRVHLLMPGGTDLQVNGGGGVLLNADPTVAGMQAIAAAHRALGTVAILPTLITDAPEVMEAAADAALAARGLSGLAGLHLEGPHIAAARRGTHAVRAIRPLDDRTLAVLRRLRAGGVPVLLTLAPETCGPARIAEAVSMGVVVSAGHTMATASQTRAAMDLGVTMFTHLYNAMPPMTARDPGVVGAAILSEAFCGLIADGHHVSPEALAIAIAARPRPDRCFLVSDAMPTVGGPDRFSLYDMDIRVQDGRLVNPEGALAGAHVSLIDAMIRLHRMGQPLDRCIAMATDIPRAAMRLPPLAIAPGTALTDLIALDEGLSLTGIA